MKEPLRRKTLLSHLTLILLLCNGALCQTQPEITRNLSDCLLRRGLSATDISFPGEPSFNQSLVENLIQDPVAHPLAYTRPADTGDVRRVVKCANELGLVFCARSGGHSWSSSSTCPGVVIDLQRVNGIVVDSARNLMTIGAGKTIGETLYQLYTTTGKIIPTGTCPSVGVGGYIQGGGFGTLSQSFGLLADNVVRMRVVDPDGGAYTASATENPSMFWALRGGGGGYLGIVTRYTLRVFDAAGTFDNNVYFNFGWEVQNGAQALREWTKYAMNTGDDTYIRMTARAGRQGLEVRATGVCWKVTSTNECLDRLARTDLWSVPGRTTNVLQLSTQGAIEAQKFFTSDGSFGTAVPSGPENTEEIFTTRFVTKAFLSDRSWGSSMWGERMMNSSEDYFQGLLDLMVSERETAEMRAIALEFYPLGQTTAERDESFSAFPHRRASAILAVFYNGGERGPRTAAKAVIQNYTASFRIGTYINYLDVDLGNYAEEYWGANLERMRSLKSSVDPGNSLWHQQPLL